MSDLFMLLVAVDVLYSGGTTSATYHHHPPDLTPPVTASAGSFARRD